MNGADGWSVPVLAMQKDYLAGTYFGMLLNVLVMVVSASLKQMVDQFTLARE